LSKSNPDTTSPYWSFTTTPTEASEPPSTSLSEEAVRVAVLATRASEATVNTNDFDTSPALIVIVVVPGLIGKMFPVESTRATSLLEEVNSTRPVMSVSFVPSALSPTTLAIRKLSPKTTVLLDSLIVPLVKSKLSIAVTTSDLSTTLTSANGDSATTFPSLSVITTLYANLVSGVKEPANSPVVEELAEPVNTALVAWNSTL
jgi:hypothetical protein